MRLLLALAAAASLAACSDSATLNNGAASNAAVPAPSPAPANALLPADDGNGSAADGNSMAGPGSPATTRPEMLAECTSQAEAMLPGVEPGPLCNCAVDRVLAGAQRRDAVRQCAAELNVQLPS